MLEQYNIRKARPDEEVQLLQERKYPEKEMDKLVKRLEITPKMLSKSIIHVAELNDEVKGFWCRELEEELSEGRLYIDLTVIKTGVGTLLIEYFTFLSDVNAQGFYEKEGAIRVSEQQLSVISTGKNIPVMRYYLK